MTTFLPSGLTNCVGISLALLYYFSSLIKFSLTFIIVLFCAIMLLMTNVLLLYGSVQKKAHLLLPWLVTNSLVTLALVIITAVKWEEIDHLKVGNLLYFNSIMYIKNMNTILY